MSVRPAPNATITGLADGGLVVLSPTGRVYRGNRMAAMLWAALTGGTGDPATVAEDIAGRFGVPVAQVRADLDRFLTALNAAGAVAAP